MRDPALTRCPESLTTTQLRADRCGIYKGKSLRMGSYKGKSLALLPAGQFCWDIQRDCEVTP